MPFFNRNSDEVTAVRKEAAKVAVLDLNHLRVRSIGDRYRRAGFSFTREAVKLTRDHFDSDDLAAMDTILALAGDRFLDAVLVQTDDSEYRLDADEINSLRDLITSLRSAATEGQPTDLVGYVEQLIDAASDNTSA